MVTKIPPNEILLIDSRDHAKDAAAAGYNALKMQTFIKAKKPPKLISDFMAEAPPALFNEPEDHSVDKKALNKWVNAHDNEWKITASKFADSIDHVSYRKWLQVFKNVLADLCNTLNDLAAHRVVIWLPEYPGDIKCTSNYWVTQIASKIMITEGCYRGLDNVVVTNNIYQADKDDIVLLFDDACYTGEEQEKLIKKNYDEMRRIYRLYIVIPFISKEAKANIESKIDYYSLHKNVILYESRWQYVMPMLRDQLKKIDEVYEGSDLLDGEKIAAKKLGLEHEEWAWRRMQYFVSNPTDELPPPIDRPTWTTYFDTEMEDSEFIAYPLRTGNVATESNRYARAIPFINGCNEKIKRGITCPVGVYKRATEYCDKIQKKLESKFSDVFAMDKKDNDDLPDDLKKQESNLTKWNYFIPEIKEKRKKKKNKV